jgi:elongation factor P hydroxylase
MQKLSIIEEVTISSEAMNKWALIRTAGFRYWASGDE